MPRDKAGVQSAMPGLLDECSVLGAMFSTGMSHDAAGDAVAIDSNLTAERADALYRLVLAQRPRLAVEVEMAFGVSSLAILSALDRLGGDGELISIDPHQSTQWRGCGIAAVGRAGLARRHQLIEEPDFSALPKLLASGRRTGLAFIDGWHTFDYTLVDFWYLDKMLEVGGIIGFDDCALRSVDKVLRFVQTHRRYEEIDVGLPLIGDDRAGVRGHVKHLLGPRVLRAYRRVAGRQRIYTRPNRYFRKAQQWEPDWDYFREF